MAKTTEEILETIYTILITVGAVLSTISIFMGSDSNVSISISAYIFFIAGIMLIVSLLINKISNQGNRGMAAFFSAFFTNAGPFLLLLGIISYTLYLIVTFKDKINSGNLSSSYGLFSKISIFFILIQLYVTYNGMQTQSFKENGSISKVNGSYSYLVGVINVFVIITLSAIMFYYTTDG
jgi:hypothetical protein